MPVRSLDDLTWLFCDAAGTLLLPQPTEAEVYKVRAARAGLMLTPEQAEHAWSKATRWALEQEIRQHAGAAEPVPEDQFLLAMHVAALHDCVAPERLPQAAAAFVRTRPPGMQWRADPEAAPVLATLLRAGLRLGVVSNFDTALPQLLERHGLADYFAVIVASAAVGVAKPDPAIMHHALQQAGADPGSSAYLGDHPLDILCAHEAGMTAIWLNRGQATWDFTHITAPDAQVSGWPELPDLLAASP